MERSEYNKNYYQNIYKDKLKNTCVYCDLCQKEYKSWNIYKHNKSKKHYLNSLSEEEREQYDKEKLDNKIKKMINKLENKLVM